MTFLLTNCRKWIKIHWWQNVIIVYFCFFWLYKRRSLLRFLRDWCFRYWLWTNSYWLSFWLICSLFWLIRLRLNWLNLLYWLNWLNWNNLLLNRLNHLVLWLLYNLGWLSTRSRRLWDNVLRNNILRNHSRLNSLYWLLLNCWLYRNYRNCLLRLSLRCNLNLSWLNDLRLLYNNWLSNNVMSLWLNRCLRLRCNLCWLRLLLLSVFINIFI